MFKFILPFCLIGSQAGCVSVDSLDTQAKFQMGYGNNKCWPDIQTCRNNSTYIKQVFDHYCKGTKQIKATFELDFQGETTKEIKDDIEGMPYAIKNYYGVGDSRIKKVNNIHYYTDDTSNTYRPIELSLAKHYVIKRPIFNGEKWNTCETGPSSQVMGWYEWVSNRFDQLPNVITIKQTVMPNNNLRFDTTVDLTYFCKNAIHIENCKF